MPDKKIIAVVGATGTQGSGLVRAILNDPDGEFAARVLTRDPDSETVREFTRSGAEIVATDIDDPASLQRAFAGAYGAYCVTFFWAHFSPEKELAEAINMANAAKQANLQHVIWSTLEDTRQWVPLHDDRMPTLMKHYKVPHFDAKGEANQAFTKLGLPTTFLLTSFYWDNFIDFGMGPKKDEDGKLTLTLPMDDKKLAGIAGEDIGKCAFGIFNSGTDFIGKTVGIAGELLSGTEMADKLGKALEQEVRYVAVPPNIYRSFGFPGADDLGNMFQFYIEFENHFQQSRDVNLARTLNPSLKTFEQWLAENKSRIPLS